MAMLFRKFSFCAAIITVLLLALYFPMAAGAGAKNAKSTILMISDPQIPLDELKLLLEPLTKAELENEAEVWLKRLQDKVQQINYAEIAVKQINREVLLTEEIIDAAEKAGQAVEAVQKAEADKDQAKPEKLEAARQAADECLQSFRDTISAVRHLEREHRQYRCIQVVQQEALKACPPPAEKSETPVPTTIPATIVKERFPTSQQLQDAAKAAQAVADAKTGIKSRMIQKITDFRAERTQLTDRVNSVLNALKLKGGDDTVHRKYISAISGIAVDVSDANSAWLSISGWLKSDQGGLRWLKNLFFFLVTILFFWLLSKAIGKATEKALKMHTRISNLMQDFMEGLIRRIIIAIGLIVALSALEVDIGPLLAVVGAAGFVVAFALQETLGNFASGIMILVYQPFDVGDLVDVAGVYGKVKRMNLVSTTISTLDNKVVMVPNNSIWGGVITNVTGTDLRRVDMTFGISYADDISAAQKVLEKIVVDHPRTLDDPAPIIQLNELADSSVNFICFPWVKTDDYWTVYWDITRTVKEQFDANGISIPFPQQDVHLHQIPPR